MPIGKAARRREGRDATMFSVGVGVHRCLEAAELLESQGVAAGVIDPRTVTPLDKETLVDEVSKTGRMLVVDEDYQGFGLSGELAAVVLEAGLQVRYGRVCTQGTIPYSRKAEEQALPNVRRILEKVEEIMREA